jgi:hypothetical protein
MIELPNQIFVRFVVNVHRQGNFENSWRKNSWN